jgi:ParB family chromosome partitioning protein
MSAAPINQSNVTTLNKGSRLGKGLSAIFGDEDPNAPDATGNPRVLPVTQLYPNRNQPRKNFDKTALEELAASIKEKGILQPIFVRPHPDKPNAYEIVAGERRWRASQMAQLHEVPVIIRDIKDKEVLEIALIENIQRADLSPMEEAETYDRLTKDYKYTGEDLATSLGKSRAHISNTLRLLQLPDTVKEMVRQNSLSAGHARALLTAKNPLQLANEIVKGGLSVRQAENLAKLSHQPASVEEEGEEDTGARRAGPSKSFPRVPRKGSATSKSQSALVHRDADVVQLEREVSSWLGLAVKLSQKSNGSGHLNIEYQTLDQLEDVLKRLSVPPKG